MLFRGPKLSSAKQPQNAANGAPKPANAKYSKDINNMEKFEGKMGFPKINNISVRTQLRPIKIGRK